MDDFVSQNRIREVRPQRDDQRKDHPGDHFPRYGAGEGTVTRQSPTHEMTLEEIAEAEGSTVGAINMCLTRASKKLRQQKLIFTCRELAAELDHNRKGIVE
jgi:hypothetical protein